ESLVSNAHLIKKVYFPRLIAPLASISVGLVDFGIAFVTLLLMQFGYAVAGVPRSEEHTSELQSLTNLVCRLLLEKKKRHMARTQKLPQATTHLRGVRPRKDDRMYLCTRQRTQSAQTEATLYSRQNHARCSALRHHLLLVVSPNLYQCTHTSPLSAVHALLSRSRSGLVCHSFSLFLFELLHFFLHYSFSLVLFFFFK